MYRAVGDLALRADTVGEPVRRAVIEGRLPEHEWPDRDLWITAIDARSGQFRVFTKADGVDLVDAVAASCAVPGIWPPVTIDGERFVDGGMRSTTNLDLAAGCDPVVVIGPSLVSMLPSPDVVRGEEDLRTRAAVVTITADEASLAAMGANPLDPATADRPRWPVGRRLRYMSNELKAVWGDVTDLRIGVLGAARITPMALVRPATRVPGAVVAAVAARDPQRAAAYAKKYGIDKVHTSYDDLLADDSTRGDLQPAAELHCTPSGR